jgi:hypothetical protein
LNRAVGQKPVVRWFSTKPAGSPGFHWFVIMSGLVRLTNRRGLWFRFFPVQPVNRSGFLNYAYDAMRSKNSTFSSRTGALLAVVLCTEVLEEVNSLTRFLFLSAPVSSESVGGGDVVELVSSSDSSASSPS